jgi:hypothetical protein
MRRDEALGGYFMRAAPHPASGYNYQASPRDRAISIGIALLICALMLWALIELGVVPSILPKQENSPIIVQMSSGSHMSATKAKAARSSSAASKVTKATVRPQPKSSPPPIPVQPPPTPTWNVIPMSHEDFAQSDISTKSSAPAARSADAGDDAGSSRGSGSGAAYGPGDGPDGQQLFNADWYRRPSHAELAGYIPSNAPPEGWGMIACRTAPDYRVEDCKQLGETPGSGLSRALREAAWQFKVRPPSINGRPQIGVWVRIRFDFTREQVGSR